MMKLLTWLFDRADRYAAQSTWRDFALVKACLFSMGVLMGLLVPARRKKWAALAAGLAFIPTYVILIRRMDVAVCWTAEFVYSAAILLFSYLYLRHGHWQGKRI